MAVAVLAACASIGAARAADLTVRYTVQSVEVRGPLATATINVTVGNQSGGAVRNVDLRIAQPASNALVQLGTIPAGEARIGKGTFTVDAGLYRSGAGLPWKVDYDDGGGHRQVVLQGRQQ
jgi:hypothetical protein